MKNVTLSIDEQVLASVRRYAAEHGTSLNQLIRAYLERTAKRHDRARMARERIRELSEQSEARLGERLPTREEIHER
jgi:hypothetical protein